jgi:hypothetical protein
MWPGGGKRQFDFRFSGLGAWAEWACSGGSRLLDFEARSNLVIDATGELFCARTFWEAQPPLRLRFWEPRS